MVGPGIIAIMTERLAATRLVPDSPEEVFALICDPQGHVLVDSTGMLQSAEGEPVSAIGDTFLVHMDRAALGDIPDLGLYDVTVVVTAFEQDRALEWTIRSGTTPPMAHRYGYLLRPADEGTEVTTYYDWSGVAEESKPRYPVIGEHALGATLGILERTLRRGRQDV
jgi:hypothetical protein